MIFAEAFADLAAQGARCSWSDPATEEVCGESATHFEGELVDYDAWAMRYEYRCHKHALFEGLASDGMASYCEESIEWEHLLQEARAAETKDQILTILEREHRRADLLYRAHHEYMERILEIEGPGTVEELDSLYRSTVEAARRSLPRRPPPKRGHE